MRTRNTLFAPYNRIGKRHQSVFSPFALNKRYDMMYGNGMYHAPPVYLKNGMIQVGGSVAGILASIASAVAPMVASYAINKGMEYIKKKKPVKKSRPPRRKTIAPISAKSKRVLDKIVSGNGVNYF